MTFVKTSRAADDRLDQEAACLAWLAEAESSGGTRIVAVLSAGPTRLELERVPDGRAAREPARRFGASLARLHAAGADWFGAPPPGWPGGRTIGRSRQPYVLPGDALPAGWGEFYAEYRISVFTRRLRDSAAIDEAEAAVLERLCARLRDGDFDAPQPRLVGERAARAHGDLWTGNVLWPPDEPTGVVLIDPLARGDHAETDLGMLALFGLPFLEDVYAGYHETSPLADGWRDRLALHALSPLLFHAVLFGGGYGAEALSVARRYA